MDDIFMIFATVLDFFNVRLTFYPFSFTILQALIGLTILGIAINVILSLFSRD